MKARQTTSHWLNPETVVDADNLPDPGQVGYRAYEIFREIHKSEYYNRLVKSAGFYCDGWATHAGFPTISNWNLLKDFNPLFEDALRVLCLKTAVYELTNGDEEAAELVIPAPVDEMIHAVLAQYTLVVPMTRKLDIDFVHMTDRERFGYKHGNYAYQCYVEAGWGEPNPRYWLDADETARRLELLDIKYTSIGIQDLCRSHEIDFAA